MNWLRIGDSGHNEKEQKRAQNLIKAKQINNSCLSLLPHTQALSSIWLGLGKWQKCPQLGLSHWSVKRSNWDRFWLCCRSKHPGPRLPQEKHQWIDQSSTLKLISMGSDVARRDLNKVKWKPELWLTTYNLPKVTAGLMWPPETGIEIKIPTIPAKPNPMLMSVKDPFSSFMAFNAKVFAKWKLSLVYFGLHYRSATYHNKDKSAKQFSSNDSEFLWHFCLKKSFDHEQTNRRILTILILNVLQTEWPQDQSQYLIALYTSINYGLELFESAPQLWGSNKTSKKDLDGNEKRITQAKSSKINLHVVKIFVDFPKGMNTNSTYPTRRTMDVQYRVFASLIKSTWYFSR